MNLVHVKYALEVERTGSISRAADALFMSQPHLSKAIRELEGTIGIPIFSRTSRGVIPTKEGKEFLDQARNIMTQIDEMESMYQQSSQHKQKCNLCAPRASYISYAFISFIKKFHLQEQLDLNYRETNAIETIKNVANAINDLGIIRYKSIYESYFLNALDERFLQFSPIWEFEALVLMSNKHPLADKELNAGSLTDYIELVHDDCNIPALPVAQARKLAKLEEEKKKIYVHERASQLEILCQIPTTFMWGSPMPPSILEQLSLVQKKCSIENNRYKDLLIYRKGYRFNQYDKMFHQTLKQTISWISE